MGSGMVDLSRPRFKVKVVSMGVGSLGGILVQNQSQSCLQRGSGWEDGGLVWTQIQSCVRGDEEVEMVVLYRLKSKSKVVSVQWGWGDLNLLMDNFTLFGFGSGKYPISTCLQSGIYAVNARLPSSLQFTKKGLKGTSHVTLYKQ